MPFEALGEDILLSILCFCDVHTVLAVSAINKPLRGVTLTKQLWLSIVQDSAFRAALELPPPDREELENQSTEELIDFVKNAVVGPGSLFNDRSSATMIHTTYKIPLHDLGDGLGAQLLPGAQYILLQNTTREKVYIYDVWNARRIWQCRVQVDTICKVDLVPGGAIARVLLAQPMNYPNKNRLQIEEVDLISGISRQVFELGCPQYLVISSLAKYDIVGDFFLCSMQDSRVWPKFILINWRTSAFIDLGNGLNFAVCPPRIRDCPKFNQCSGCVNPGICCMDRLPVPRTTDPRASFRCSSAGSIELRRSPNPEHSARKTGL
ncbi:hypothetical protein C8R45DRAFT_1015123 [Mycena sanguinolenta]|nr:hypothetical protein C8R45DRAFT_1015123 [Mycena sanguinolenta]